MSSVAADAPTRRGSIRMSPPAASAVARRLLHAVLALWIAYTLAFALFQLLPADPVQIMVGPQNVVSESDREALRRQLGLDQPVVFRYAAALWAAVQGDLGTSFRTGRDVSAMIADAIGPTAELAALAVAIAIPLAVASAVIVAVTRSVVVRELLLSIPPVVQSLPTFWVGLLLLQAFAFGLRLLPPGGSASPASAVLPAVALALPAAALIAQTLAVRLVDESREPYAVAAAARGYRPWRVVSRHTLRNAAAPALSMVGLLIGWLLSGAVVIETVYARDGLGQLVQHAVSTQDLPVVQGVVVVSAAVFLLATAGVDLLQRLVDPRLREAAPAQTRVAR